MTSCLLIQHLNSSVLFAQQHCSGHIAPPFLEHLFLWLHLPSCLLHASNNRSEACSPWVTSQQIRDYAPLSWLTIRHSPKWPWDPKLLLWNCAVSLHISLWNDYHELNFCSMPDAVLWVLHVLIHLCNFHPHEIQPQKNSNFFRLKNVVTWYQNKLLKVTTCICNFLVVWL